MTGGLVRESGVFRNGDVGVLMKDLFAWMKREKDLNLLILSSVFHYEFVFIHPFSDGNGRMRL